MANLILLEAKLKAQEEKLNQLQSQLGIQTDPRYMSSLQQSITKQEQFIALTKGGLEAAKEADKAKKAAKLPKLAARARFLKQKAQMLTTQAQAVEAEIEAIEK